MAETVISSHNSPSVCLGNGNPNRLVSLYELLTIFAASFARSISLISTMRALTQQNVGSIPSPTLHEITGNQFEELSEQLLALGLTRQSASCRDQARFMREHQTFPHKDTLDKLWVLILHDLESVQLLRIAPEKAPFLYSTEPLFGLDVHQSFPSANFDISEAGNCLALERWNGCVYHLMRSMEIPLCCLANKFGVSSDHSNWNKIIEQTERAVRDMSNNPSKPVNWKDEQEFYSQACGQFIVIKDAWRNYTAHARAGKYDEREARSIMEAVKMFMQKLAPRLHEIVPP